ncbi:MAG: endo-1,4-beta-xylanase [Phycisphaerae bacterium]
MNRRRFLQTTAATALVPTLLATGRAGAGAPSDEDLLASAPDRIETRRKADAEVRVVDAAGKPVAGAEVRVRQTRHAFLFGSNIYKWGRLPEQREDPYRRRFDSLLNFATIAFYWSAYERERGKPRHEYAEQVARWCAGKHIARKGHPLAWNHADPRWLPDDPETIRRLQMDRIEDCVSRFRGLIDTWDVVNEATHFDRKEFAERRAPKHTRMWKEVGRVEFARQCFRHARKANPDATLLINDYRTDPAYEKVIEGLVDDQGGRLYDVIGIQSHQHGGVWPTRKIWTVCERFARFGVPLHFTETTVLSGKQGWKLPRNEWKTDPEREAWQAREVVRFYTMLFSHPAVEAITWWDFSDYHAWQGAPAGLVRNDMSPKPAYEALMKRIKGEWWTETTVRTGAGGTAKVRGFLGRYAVTARGAGKEAAADVDLVRGKPNRWTLRLG